jgi:hypothetical protein
MSRIAFIFIIFSFFVHASEENHKEESNVRLVLASFLQSLRGSDWRTIYELHSSGEQKVMLGDAFVNLYLLARDDGPRAQSAKELIQSHYKKKEADVKVANSKNPLTKNEEMLLRLKFVTKPEELYDKWRNIEEKNSHIDQIWLDSIAKNIDFHITIGDGTATASGSEEKNIKVNFIKENEKWKILGGWHVQK